MSRSENLLINYKDTIRKNFSKAATLYDYHADNQRRAATYLRTLLSRKSWDNILDLGCGTGDYTRLLADRYPQAKITAIDISDEMISTAQSKSQQNSVKYIGADIETYPFTKSYDLITSNVSLQWVKDFDGLSKRIGDNLHPQGEWVFSVFGPSTYIELQLALKNIFGEDISLEAERFLNSKVIEAILDKNFIISYKEEIIWQSKYRNIQDLLKTIRYTGTKGIALHARQMTWTKGILKELNLAYPGKKKRTNESSFIDATYQLFLFKVFKK